MNARYFKMMFHNVNEGIVYSVGVADSETKKKWTAYYICQNQGEKAEALVMEQRFAVCREQVRLVVAGDGSKETVQLLVDFVKENRVEQVVIPVSQNKIADKLCEAGAKRVVELKPGSSLYEEKDFWKFHIRCYGTEDVCGLVMFSGPVGIDWKGEDCLMNIKPFQKEMPCLAEMDTENHTCCMRCGLYNDFDMCKGHNQNTGKGYVAGTLLLGNVEVMKYLDYIKKDFSDTEEQLRFISLIEGSREADSSFVEWAGKARKELNHYYVLPSKHQDTDRFVKKVLAQSGRNRVFLTGENSGICGTGFFTSRMN